MTDRSSRPARPGRWRAVVGVLLLALAATVVTTGVATVLSGRGQLSGRVTVAGCVRLPDRMHPSTYSCTGSFAADDDSFRIARVTFLNGSALAAGTRAAATVTGPDAGTAALAGEAAVRLAVTAGCVLLLAALVLLWRWRRPARPSTRDRHRT